MRPFPPMIAGRVTEIPQRKLRLDSKNTRLSGPKHYYANPLEFLLASLSSAPPLFQTGQLPKILSRVIIFLGDKDLPIEYSKWFFDGLERFIRSNERKARMNAWFIVTGLKDDYQQAAELKKRSEMDGTWTRVEKELRDYFDSFGPANSDLRKRLAENLERTTKPPFAEAPAMKTAPHPILVSKREQENEMQILNLAKEAYRLETQGKFQEALSFYERALALKSLDKSTDRSIRFAKSNCHTRFDQNNEALEVLDDLCSEEPGDPTYHSARGIALMKLERLDEALATMDKALELDPGRPTTLLNKANLLSKMGRVKEGALLLEETLEKNPNHPAIRTHQEEFSKCFDQAAADALVKRDFNLAVRFANRSVDLNPRSHIALCIKGSIMTERGLYEDAVSLNEQALQLEPNSSLAIEGSAKALFLSGRLEKAISRYSQAVRCNPNNARVWNDFGSCCAQAGLWDKARSCFERALALEPSHPLHWSNMGGTCLQTGKNERDFEQGLKHFDQALALDPAHLQSMFGRGIALYYLNRYEEASLQLKALLKLAPHFPQAADLLEKCEKAQGEK